MDTAANLTAFKRGVGVEGRTTNGAPNASAFRFSKGLDMKSEKSQAVRLLAEIAAIRQDLATLTESIRNVLEALPPTPPADATAAYASRQAATLRGFYWAAEFASVIGRHTQFVSGRCAARVIHTLKGGKPYRIPLTEETRWNGGAS